MTANQPQANLSVDGNLYKAAQAPMLRYSTLPGVKIATTAH